MTKPNIFRNCFIIFTALVSLFASGVLSSLEGVYRGLLIEITASVVLAAFGIILFFGVLRGWFNDFETPQEKKPEG